MTEDVYVRLVDFPTTTVSEAVTKNADGTFTVFINARMNDRKQNDAYRHALKHIKSCDFEKEDVGEIEANAHKK